jgi:hypothetical protein
MYLFPTFSWRRRLDVVAVEGGTIGGMEEMPSRRKVLGILGGVAGAAALGANAEAAEKKVDALDINERMNDLEQKIGELQAAITRVRELQKETKLENLGDEFKSFDAIAQSGAEIEKLTRTFNKRK